MKPLIRRATKAERLIALTFLPLAAIEYLYAKYLNDNMMKTKLLSVWLTVSKGVVTDELA